MTAMATLGQVQGWVRSGTLVGRADVAFDRVTTDSRNLQPGDLFVALEGERFDAHDFLAQARVAGAVAALAQRGLADAGLNGLQVPDSRIALGELSAGWRARHGIPLIAVTGSNGKTTVTQMVAAILEAHAGAASLATRGNFNNDIGVPLTLLRLRPEHQFAVLELGMNHPGEIATLAAMARPTVALVNNAQREHQEFMGTVEAVAHENGSVFSSLPTDGVAVFPADDIYTPVWQDLAAGRRCITFATAGTADVLLTRATWQSDAWHVEAATPAGAMAFGLHIAGLHNVKNALAATAASLGAGVPLAAIVAGLEAFAPVKGRSRAIALTLRGRPLTVVDDTYNANPDSVVAAIDVLAELPGPQVLVLGDMGEVGEEGPAFHREAGLHAQARGIDTLLALGEQSVHSVQAFCSAGGQGLHFTDIASLLQALDGHLGSAGSVLVKGSRFMQMERAVEAITSLAQQQEEGASR